MTRFARARGSKASNERVPEDSTPWEVMKEQFLQAKKDNDDSKNRKEAEQKRIENYENFLKDQKVQKRKATWCDFPENNRVELTHNECLSVVKKKNKKKLKLENQTDQPGDINIKDNNVTDASASIKKMKKKKKKILNESISLSDTQLRDQAELINIKTNNISKGEKDTDKAKKTKKVKNKSKNEAHSLSITQVQSQTKTLNYENSCDITDPNHTDNAIKKSKKKNKKAQNGRQSLSTEDGIVNPIQSIKEFKQKENSTTGSSEQNNNMQKNKQAINKKNKLVDGKPVRRKAINDHSFQLIINGKEIELVRCDGFPVMKKDAERIQELKTSMIKKGIPKSEVQRTIKLERRRAEKALARVKRDVCYNCRKGGHILSDCPELKEKIPAGNVADGICFKCGSTEHRQFECKVQRDKEFRFATCFICKEPGHIARQCPDNPKGLYPNGGSCKLCGDVTHLRKDCPTVMDKKEETTVKLQTIDSSENIEDVGLQTSKLVPAETAKKPKKIKF